MRLGNSMFSALSIGGGILVFIACSVCMQLAGAALAIAYHLYKRRSANLKATNGIAISSHAAAHPQCTGGTMNLLKKMAMSACATCHPLEQC